MRTLIAAVAGLAVAAAAADDPKPKADPPAKTAPPKRAAPALKVGDKAPVLKADKWLHGAEVPAFEPGKVYVVEFWATWCGPCIAAMPHLADLADEYKGKGLTVIGFTSKAQDQWARPRSSSKHRLQTELQYVVNFFVDHPARSA